MNTQTITRLLITFVIYLFLQIFVIRNFVLFDVAFCFVYIGCILLLPNEIGTTTTLLLSFLVGITVDVFYNTAGIHASATVLMGYLKGYIVKFLFPTKGLDTDITISLGDMGAERFIRYVIILTLIHHTLLFFVEAGNVQQLFIITVLKIVCSTIFTSFMIFILQYLRRQ